MQTQTKAPAPLRSLAYRRLAGALAVGLVVGASVAPFVLWQPAALIGWDVAAATFLGLVWTRVAGLDTAHTRELARREDPGVGVSDLLVVGAGLACLVGIGLNLVRAQQYAGAQKALLVALGILSVMLSWGSVHTIFTLRYARLYYTSDPGSGIDFHDPKGPDYRDFAYLAFTVGMTFQVSDPEITDKTMRRTVLRHSLLSFVFGAVILGLTINVVSNLLH